MNYSIKDLINGAKVMAKSVFGKKKEYQLQFNHEEDGLWYIDYPNWPFDHHKKEKKPTKVTLNLCS